METPEKENDSLDNTDYPQEHNLTGRDILIVLYYMKCCRCPDLIFFIMGIIFFPIAFLAIYILTPDKKQIIIDEDKKELIQHESGKLACCCHCNDKTFYLKSIKKIRLYATWRPDPKIGFNKLYFMNCEVISLNDESEKLFENIKYDEKKYAEFASYFKRHLKTEVEPLETAKRAKGFNSPANNDDDPNLNYNIMNSDDLNNPMVNNNNLNMGNEMDFHNPTSGI